MSLSGQLRRLGLEISGGNLYAFRGGISPSAVATSRMKTALVAITNAQIKALRATPKVLVAAPGAGKWLELVSATLILDAGTNVLSETGDNLVIQYGTSGLDVTAAIETTGFIDQAVNQVAHVKAATIATGILSDMVNNNLVLFNTGDGEIAGNAALDALLKVIVTYWEHDDAV